MKRLGLKQWAIFILLSYFVIGSVYYLASYARNLVIGKQIVFSPIIGLPLTIIGWPQMVYADIIHLQSLGLNFPTVLVLVLLLSMICFVIITIVKESQTTHS
ncbi:MAG: hypothetical protein K0B06_07930 [Brevefilum sp.]|nr:hypothetical protein [Brevefilum sp.]